MKATAAELESVSLIDPGKAPALPSRRQNRRRWWRRRSRRPASSPNARRIPPLVPPKKGPSAEAPSYKSEPTSEGQKAFHAASEEIIGGWPLEKALGVEGHGTTFTDAAAEASFASLGNELSSQQLTRKA